MLLPTCVTCSKIKVSFSLSMSFSFNIYFWKGYGKGVVLAVTVEGILKIRMQVGCPMAVGMGLGATLTKVQCHRVGLQDMPPHTSPRVWVRTTELLNHYYYIQWWNSAKNTLNFTPVLNHNFKLHLILILYLFNKFSYTLFHRLYAAAEPKENVFKLILLVVLACFLDPILIIQKSQ